jgi:hypothetical protein
MVGSVPLEEVETAIVERLEELGYSVDTQSFTASTRSMVAVAVTGAACGWMALILAPFLVVGFSGWPVTVTGFAAFSLVVLLAVGVNGGMIPVPTWETTATNIVAQRGEPPAFWLVAHSDSKAQLLSLAGRVLAVGALAAGLSVLTVGLVARLFVPLPWWVAAPAVVLMAVGGAALSRGTVSDDSPGAVDNATGVIAALVAAERLRSRANVGVLVTGAEELAMAGARAWLESGASGGEFVNFDGIDSCGRYRLKTHGRRGTALGERSAEIARVLVEKLAESGEAVGRLGLPPGVLVDGVILQRSGMPGVTVSRGAWRTLRVVHTEADLAERVDIAAAVCAGEAAARAIEALC